MKRLVLELWGVRCIRTLPLTPDERKKRADSWKEVFGRNVKISEE